MRRLRAGELAILPTDTVYGIACAAYLRPAVERLYALKQRPASQPTAIMCGSVENLLSNVLPEARERAGAILQAVMPGPVTLIVPNPARRFAATCGDTPEAIGVRVPVLQSDVAALADAVGGVVISSANARGEPAPARVDDVPGRLREACGVVVDAGLLPGTPSVVIDVCGAEPVIVRDAPGSEQLVALINASAR